MRRYADLTRGGGRHTTSAGSIGRPKPPLPSTFIDTELMKTLSDELRVRIFAYLCDHTASATELARVLSAKLSRVRYHLDELRGGGWIAEDSSVSGKASHYRAVQGMVLPPSVWKRLPQAGRQRIAVRLLRLLYADAGASMAAGRFLDPDAYLSLTPMVVDSQGMEDARQVLEQALERLLGVQEQSDQRRKTTSQAESETTSITVALLGFTSTRDPAEGARASSTLHL
jgi:DNA-binding transcriptional ArsR family regulator